MITAVEIDELYYAEPITTVTTPVTGLTGAEVAAILKNAATKKVQNVHGDTFQYEEAEASVTRYKNALTGEYYRESSEPGEVKINFTIGEYDYKTKEDLQGGKATEKNWERGKHKTIHKCVIGKLKMVSMWCSRKRLSTDVVLIPTRLSDWLFRPFPFPPVWMVWLLRNGSMNLR